MKNLVVVGLSVSELGHTSENLSDCPDLPLVDSAMMGRFWGAELPFNVPFSQRIFETF